MVRLASISRLSGTIYRFLKRLGIAPSTSLYHRSQRVIASKQKWGEVEVALRDEIRAAKNSSTARLLNRKLLNRIEALDNKTSPMTAALFENGPALREEVDSQVSIDITNNENLTDSQKDALEKGVHNRFLFVMGAAATGKTRVTTRLIREFVAAGQTTLLCCHTKAALNHTMDCLDDDTRSSVFFRGRTFGSLVMEEITTPFDNVVVDEAGVAHIAYILYVSSISRQRLIFVGDPIQIGPITNDDREQSPWVKHNIFQMQSGMENLSQLYSWQERNPDLSVLLRDQFEIPERIFNVINHFCYGNRLSNRTQGRGLISIIDTSELSPSLIGRRSPINALHGDIVISTLKELLSKQSITAESIGVITPFRAQSRHLEQFITNRELPESIQVGTAHTWQGRMKSVVILDLTVSGVDHTFKVLADNNQAMGLINSALSRCRTDKGTEGRLIVVCNIDHINMIYRDSAVARFVNRLVSNADSVTKPTETIPTDQTSTSDNTQRYAQLTDTLVQEFNAKYQAVSVALSSSTLPDQADVEALIWNGYDLIPRLIGLCNRLKPAGQPDWFRLSDDKFEALEQPLAALELANLSEDVRFKPGSYLHFRALVSDLYMVIHESSMIKSTSGRNQNPPEPIFDPNAMNGESYGRIRIFVASLRNHFEHDIKKWEEWQRQNNKRQRDSFFKHAIDKPAPEKHQDYSSLDYLRATLFALKDTIGYLEAVRERLRKGN